MVKRSIPLFFERLQLEKIYCEPFAENPGPNNTLIKLGFQLIEKYKGISSSICFEQWVNRYMIQKDHFDV